MSRGWFKHLVSVASSLAALAAIGCAGAEVPQAPEVYRGRTGATVLAVPSAIASSVLYEGESDWTPPVTPKARRTAHDPIRVIEFYVDLDHPDELITAQAARDRLLVRRESTQQVAVVGHVVGVAVAMAAAGLLSAAEMRAQFGAGRLYPAPAFRALKPAPSEYGFETRRADWSRQIADRKRHGNGLFDVDVDYLSRSADTWIFCNDARQLAAPFSPMPTCSFKIVVPPLNAVVSGSIDRVDVPRWRALRSAALLTLNAFVVPGG